MTEPSDDDLIRSRIKAAASGSFTQADLDRLILNGLATAVAAFVDNALAAVPAERREVARAELVEALPRAHLMIRLMPFQVMLAAKEAGGSFRPLYVAGAPSTPTGMPN